MMSRLRKAWSPSVIEVHAVVEQLLVDLRRQAGAARGVLGVGDDAVDGPLL